MRASVVCSLSPRRRLCAGRRRGRRELVLCDGPAAVHQLQLLDQRLQYAGLRGEPASRCYYAPRRYTHAHTTPSFPFCCPRQGWAVFIQACRRIFLSYVWLCVVLHCFLSKSIFSTHLTNLKEPVDLSFKSANSDYVHLWAHLDLLTCCHQRKMSHCSN